MLESNVRALPLTSSNSMKPGYFRCSLVKRACPVCVLPAVMSLRG